MAQQLSNGELQELMKRLGASAELTKEAIAKHVEEDNDDANNDGRVVPLPYKK